MANTLYARKNVILRCNNVMLGELHYYLQRAVQEKNLENNKAIINFMDGIDQDAYGAGLASGDLDSFNNQIDDVMIFADLVEVAIKEALQDRRLSNNAEQMLWDFKNNILIYADHVKNNKPITSDIFLSSPIGLGFDSILTCTNQTLKMLHAYLVAEIAGKNIVHNEIIMKFVDAIDQNKYKPGRINVSIERMFESHIDDLSVLIDLFVAATQKGVDDKAFDQQAAEALQKYIQSLMAYLHQQKLQKGEMHVCNIC